MKVKDLIEALNELPPELPIWKASDGEGNSFSVVDFVSEDMMRDHGWGSYPMHPEDLEELRAECEEENEEFPHNLFFKAVVLW